MAAADKTYASSLRSQTVLSFGHVWDTELLAWIKEPAIDGGSTVNTKTDLTPASPTAATVGVTTGQAVAANANRKGLILVNTSTNRISIAFGTSAVLDSGITLMASGGTFCMGEYDFDTGAVNAIASGASSNLAIQEFS